MRSNTPKRNDRAFTLVEILVALAVAGGALILVLSAANAALRQSVRSREEAQVERAAETKFEECLIGSERGLEGELPGFSRWRWSIEASPARVAGLKKLRQLTFTVRSPDGARTIEWQRLGHASGGLP